MAPNAHFSAFGNLVLVVNPEKLYAARIDFGRTIGPLRLGTLPGARSVPFQTSTIRV
jgi:hypothetical protein